MKGVLWMIILAIGISGSKAQSDICSVDTLTTDSGSVITPNHPSNYGNNVDCQVTISTTSDKVIVITFAAMSIEPNNTCNNDYLEVYDGAELYTGTRLCGNRNPRTFAAVSSSVRIVFHSNSIQADTGFKIHWAVTDRCTSSEYTCWNGNCIPSSQKCDKVNQCTDDSDEIECVQTPATSDQCGKVLVAPGFTWDPRIVGGNEAVSGSWPWQVGVQNTGGTSPFCGGSILSTEWILTAAHCIEAETIANPASVEVVAGKHSFTSGANQTSTAQQVCVHPSYVSPEQGYDVALLKLSTALTYNNIVRPICISPQNFIVDVASTAIATGWGLLASEGNTPSALTQVRVPVISQTQCNSLYSHITILDSMLCTGDTTTGGVDACQGDSGGPLVVLSGEDTWYQVGITSFGTGCADPQFPGVFTKVSSFSSWINATMQGPLCTTTTIITANRGASVVSCGVNLSIFTTLVAILMFIML